MTNPQLADRFGADVLANPVGLSTALETSDGFLLMGRRNERVAYYPGRLHPFAGFRRELGEELSLDEPDVPLIRCTGIVEDVALRQPELIFRVECALTRKE